MIDNYLVEKAKLLSFYSSSYEYREIEWAVYYRGAVIVWTMFENCSLIHLV